MEKLLMTVVWSYLIHSQLHRLKIPPRLLCPWDFLARILEWVAIPFSRGTSQPRDRIKHRSPALQADSSPSEPPGKPCELVIPGQNFLWSIFYFLWGSGWCSFALFQTKCACPCVGGNASFTLLQAPRPLCLRPGLPDVGCPSLLTPEIMTLILHSAHSLGDTGACSYGLQSKESFQLTSLPQVTLPLLLPSHWKWLILQKCFCGLYRFSP